MASKIFLHIPNETACSLYRGVLPLNHCYHELTKHDIRLIGDKAPLFEEDFTHYIFNRIISEDFYNSHVLKFIADGKPLVWQSDDDLWNVPSWNPSSKLIKPHLLETTNIFMEKSSMFIVSTDALSQLINKPEKTVILPNLIDTAYFNMKGEKEQGPIKIVWAGSVSHEKDLEEIIEPLVKILEKYKEKVVAIFWGYLPTELANFEREPGFPHANLVPKYPNLFFGEWFNGRIFYEKLMQLQTDISLIPLNDCQFNKSKSNLKYLEMSMSGAACIATDLTPYQCIKHNETGILVAPGDKESWYNYMEELIENEELRLKLTNNAQQQIREEYSWQCYKREKWIEAFVKISKL